MPVPHLLSLMLPTLALGDEYDTDMRLLFLEQRTLDLEMQLSYQRQALADAEVRAASAERQAEIDAIFAPPSKPSYEPRALDVDVGSRYLPPPKEPARSMRPPWLQPVDPMAQRQARRGSGCTALGLAIAI